VHSHFPVVRVACIVLLVALVALAPALYLASDLAHGHDTGKHRVHGWLGKVPWASDARLVSPALDPRGPALVPEQPHPLPLIAESVFIPPRR
jgi:hypothetical protein